MANRFGNIDKIASDASKLLVYGFIRNTEQNLFKDQRDNPYYNIPAIS